MLDKQYQCYSVSTNDFNSREEQDIFNDLLKYRRWKKGLTAAKKRMINKEQRPRGFTGDDITAAVEQKYKEICKNLDLNQKIEQKKAEYISKIQQNTLPRTLNPAALNEYHEISMFESTLSRISGFQINQTTKDLIVVETFFYDITKQNVLYGFYLNGEKYCYLYSSAGEIRTKKTVFIKESLLKRIELTLRCGLTLDEINKKGGLNPNKWLAYSALSSSATDWWNDDENQCKQLGIKPFDIDKCIVVEDYEDIVHDDVDYIDPNDYSIARKTVDVTIAHTDGAGLVDPECCKQSFMIRLPFVKGALCSWDFKAYIREKGYSPIIKDIYGKPHDVLAEDIQVIFTKSQFKLWKYYSSWEDYKQKFKQYHCQAGICNKEPVHEDGSSAIPTSAINYQELQSLIDFTEDELNALVKTSNLTLRQMSGNQYTMLRVFGATDYNQNKEPYQEALYLYPELLRDAYSKEKLRQIKNSLVKRFKAGKLEIIGKYTFIFPDWTCVIDNLFGNIEHPKGLLQNGEVYCSLYRDVKELDCLRSPHLYMEHAVRTNKVNEQTDKWFGNTPCLYTSAHDLISRILQFDVDGDRSLVIADQTVVKLAKKNLEKYDIVPLYYEMYKSSAKQLTPETIYEGLEAGFKGSNIGIYSNNISKIWNSVDWQHIDEEEIKKYLRLISLLCAENNYCIDRAKTLYMPTRPEYIDQQIKDAIHCKVPHFFIYAKGKTESQVEPKTNSIVNRLEDKIVNPRLNYKSTRLGKLNYRYLMNNEQIGIDQRIIDKYNEIGKTYHYRLNIPKSGEDLPANLNAVVLNIRKEFETAFPEYSLLTISDMLVRNMYHDRTMVTKKDMLWQVFGDFIVENLKMKVPRKSIQCILCGTRFVPNSNAQKFCPECYSKRRKEYKKDWMKEYRYAADSSPITIK